MPVGLGEVDLDVGGVDLGGVVPGDNVDHNAGGFQLALAEGLTQTWRRSQRLKQK
jgi:2-iminoacetate synthase ThiH